jgi:hypothetical protein
MQRDIANLRRGEEKGRILQRGQYPYMDGTEKMAYLHMRSSRFTTTIVIQEH